MATPGVLAYNKIGCTTDLGAELLYLTYVTGTPSGQSWPIVIKFKFKYVLKILSTDRLKWFS